MLPVKRVVKPLCVKRNFLYFLFCSFTLYEVSTIWDSKFNIFLETRIFGSLKFFTWNKISLHFATIWSCLIPNSFANIRVSVIGVCFPPTVLIKHLKRISHRKHYLKNLEPVTRFLQKLLQLKVNIISSFSPLFI